MRSLTKHLRDATDHGALPFHVECPLCRTARLAGALGSDALAPKGAEALLVGAALALFAVAPAAALKADPRHSRQEATITERPGPSKPAANPDADPGGESVDLPPIYGPPEQSQTSDDPGSSLGSGLGLVAGFGLDSETEPDPAPPRDHDTAAPLAGRPQGAPDQAAAKEPTPVEQQPPASPEEPRPQPEPMASAAPSPPTAPVNEPTMAAFAPPTVDSAHAQTSGPRRSVDPQPRQSRSGRTMVVSGRARKAPAATTAAPGGRASLIRRAATSKSDDAFHVVRAGESLWGIADEMLGGGASAAQIAREVNKLWERNKDIIRTGDPDLLMVGTRVRLR